MSTHRKTLPAATANLIEVLPAEPPCDRHDGWTPERQAAFLRALAATHNVSAAAREVGMTRQSAYKLRARLKGEPFDLAWDAAFQSAFDALAEAAMERALKGVEVPHYFQGELVGTSRRYDERLTVALLLMRERRRTAPAAWHIASAYGRDDLGKLLARVKRGPETWQEEHRAGMDAVEDWDDEDEEYEDDGEDGEYEEDGEDGDWEADAP